jgi:hypothetical protein
MSLWYCRECKRAHSEEQMLPGWNGLWCPNCIWNEVTRTPEPGLRAGRAQTGSVREHNASQGG